MPEPVIRAQAPSALNDYLLLTLLAMIFGSSFLFTHIAVQSIPPLTVAAMRLFIALLILYPVMRLAGQRLPAMGRLWFYI
ncbi:MAG: EamA family transporter, partial [Granulosicoccus sp.]|nr:EamA family transporter [Granulosicoccus sp.]